jgi:hypothetical protein
VTPVKLTAGRPLRTVTGTFDELADLAGDVPDEAWLRVRVNEPSQAGLGDRVRELLGPNVVDVQVVAARSPVRAVSASGRMSKAPAELFDEYLAHEGIDDRRVAHAFQALLDAEDDEMAGR